MIEKNKRLEIRLTESEDKQIEEKMKLARMHNKSAYIRKMAIDGYIINVDVSDIIEVVRLVRSISNNINQIAKHTNETGVVYKSEVEEIKEQYEELLIPLRDALQKINMITKI
jgi:hypothetical protein